MLLRSLVVHVFRMNVCDLRGGIVHQLSNSTSNELEIIIESARASGAFLATSADPRASTNWLAPPPLQQWLAGFR